MLSAEQRDEFELRGVVKLAGAVDPGRAGAFRNEILAFVAANGIRPTGPGQWLAVSAGRTARVARAHGFAEIWGPTVIGAIDALVGADRWRPPKHAGQILALTWPQPEQRWDISTKSWHLDYPAPGAARALPGVQIFLCLDRVESRGGATLVAAGLPRFVDAIRQRRGPGWDGRSSDVRGSVAREVPWFRALTTFRDGEDRIARFLEKPTAFEDNELQVVELTGEPGDVWLMHPWMLHNASPNCLARPRMVLTERIRATDA